MRQVLVALLMLAPMLILPSAAAVEGRSSSGVICCPASEVELFMLGSAAVSYTHLRAHET